MFFLRLDVVTEQRLLIADVELAIRNHWMRPGRFVRTVGLVEPSTLQVFLAAGFNQNNWTVLGAVVDSAVCERDRAFSNPSFILVALVPQDIARFEVETDKVASSVAAVGSKQGAVVEDHAAVMILDLPG